MFDTSWSMSTCWWGILITVLCVGTLVRTAGRDTRTRGVYYKPKHLEQARGTLVYPPAHIHRDAATDPEHSDISSRTRPDNHPVQRSYMLAIRPVPVDVYREAMTSARTHYDVFRIFLPLGVSDAEIDRMIWSRDAMSDVLTIIQGSGMPHFTPGIHPTPTTPQHTTALVPVHNKHKHAFSDVHDDMMMMSDSPVCDMCHRIPAGGPLAGVLTGSGRSGSRSGQLQAESWHRRRRRHKPSVEKVDRGTRRCKKRRRALSANIKKCRLNKNQRRCRTLRARYKRLRQACKRDSDNQSIIPGGAASLPDPHRPTTTTTTTSGRRPRPDPGAPASDTDQWKLWEKTKSETDEHGRCGKPVPQVVRVREILARGDEEYFPSCVLRYRCRRDAGCCQHEFQVCSATKSEKIEKTVLVAKVHSQDHRVHYQNLTMKTFTLDNDTDCGCVEMVTPVEKPCPHPFVFDMDSQTCKCRDASFKKSCRRIQRGEKELMPSDIRCIKEEKCRALSICSYGNFDMTRFRCPPKPEGDVHPTDTGKRRRHG